MTGRAASAIIGRWRIVSSDMWDHDFLDLVEPARIEFPSDGLGAFAFGAVTGATDCRYGEDSAFFTWVGSDEMDETSGAGDAELNDHGSLTIELNFHRGDDAILIAKKW